MKKLFALWIVSIFLVIGAIIIEECEIYDLPDILIIGLIVVMSGVSCWAMRKALGRK